MQESSKLGNTSTSNGYKWAIKHKYTKFKCGSLVVQVCTQILMKTISRHVIKTWNMKQSINQYDHYVNAHDLELGYTQ